MENKDLIVTEFDLLTTKGSTQILKALIPFLAPREQKMIGIIIRIWELIQTIRFFEKQTFPHHGKQSGLDFNPELVQHIKKYCTPDSQHMIDMILQFMNMSELMNIMNMFENETPEKNSNSGNDFGNIMNIFQTMNKTGLDISGMNMTGMANNSSIQPSSIIESMMTGKQESLYQEFLDKLNQDLTD